MMTLFLLSLTSHPGFVLNVRVAYTVRQIEDQLSKLSTKHHTYIYAADDTAIIFADILRMMLVPCLLFSLDECMPCVVMMILTMVMLMVVVV